MSMRQTYLWFTFYLWFIVTPCTLISYFIPWVSGSRIPGRRLGCVPLLKRFRRRNARSRLDAVREKLPENLRACPESKVLTSDPLVNQVHAHATWAQASLIYLAAPGMLASAALALVVNTLAWRASSLWAVAVYLTFVYVSAFLTCIDIWAVRNADSAGAVTLAAVGVLESFTTRAKKAPAKSTPAVWQSQLIEQLCTVLVRRAHRESAGAVPGSRLTMAQNTACLVRALRHHIALIHDSAESEERPMHERELWLLICNILKYSSRPRADVVDFRVVDPDLLAAVPDVVPEASAVPSPKARVLVPLLFICALAAVAVVLGATGAAGEVTQPIVVALALAVLPFARRFGVTALDAFAQPPVPAPASPQVDPQPVPEPVRRAA
ncbi:hypothetical protein OHT59_33115 [Streptomyces sp. NBC_00243]|uniref:hypothetical protein n=1 Tax=Streptomyces sp. NBC_00243 TaxID=2975688 RepID=UPI002DD8F971|nr:hypothetical protein [Streptomyces sp. NBC_00243]WRZ22981.1 hypothetical protein OHT59_33115 [Streptomyces sp. NBC_00243]